MRKAVRKVTQFLFMLKVVRKESECSMKDGIVAISLHLQRHVLYKKFEKKNPSYLLFIYIYFI